jgi:uncharacterized membrane protein YtjA (UPF0391 family)
MLGLSILFFLLAVAAGILGFGGLAGTFTSIAVIAFYVFVALLIVSLLAQAFGGAGRRGGALGAVVVVLVLCAGIYVWSRNNGAARENLDAAVSEAGAAFRQTDQAAKKVVNDVAQDARDALKDDDGG